MYTAFPDSPDKKWFVNVNLALEVEIKNRHDFSHTLCKPQMGINPSHFRTVLFGSHCAFLTRRPPQLKKRFLLHSTFNESANYAQCLSNNTCNPFQDDPLSPLFGMVHFLLTLFDETSIWIFDRYGWGDILRRTADLRSRRFYW